MVEHIISARQFSRERLEIIFQSAAQIEQMYRRDPRECLTLFNNKKRRGALIFFQPSTRTHKSFKKAFDRLGMEIVYDTISAATSSSAAKGESISAAFLNMGAIDEPDTVDVVVLRHPDDDAAEQAALIAGQFGSHLISAGSGKKEHPTQMILDLYTIYQHRERQIDGIKIVLGGDPEASRTIHSLVLALALNYNVPVIGVCGPNGSSLPPEVLESIKRRTEIINFTSYAQALEWQPDYVYVTRPQLEHYLTPGASPEKKLQELMELIPKFRFLKIDDALAKRMQEINCFFMHPQPIDSIHFNEILQHLITHPNSLLLKQTGNGVWTRMAAIIDLLS